MFWLGGWQWLVGFGAWVGWQFFAKPRSSVSICLIAKAESQLQLLKDSSALPSPKGLGFSCSGFLAFFGSQEKSLALGQTGLRVSSPCLFFVGFRGSMKKVISLQTCCYHIWILTFRFNPPKQRKQLNNLQKKNE